MHASLLTDARAGLLRVAGTTRAHEAAGEIDAHQDVSAAEPRLTTLIYVWTGRDTRWQNGELLYRLSSTSHRQRRTVAERRTTIQTLVYVSQAATHGGRTENYYE